MRTRTMIAWVASIIGVAIPSAVEAAPVLVHSELIAAGSFTFSDATVAPAGAVLAYRTGGESIQLEISSCEAPLVCDRTVVEVVPLVFEAIDGRLDLEVDVESIGRIDLSFIAAQGGILARCADAVTGTAFVMEGAAVAPSLVFGTIADRAVDSSTCAAFGQDAHIQWISS